MRIRRNNKGYGLLEFMIVFSVLAIMSGVAFNALSALRKNHAIEEDEAALDLREIAKQEFLLQGINFEEAMNPLEEYGDVGSRIEKTNSRLNALGKNDVALLSADFEAQRDRIKVVGKVIKDSGSPQNVKKTTLLSPIANFSGTVHLTDFPIKNFIASARNNPLGTYYRYTTDGSDPTIASPVWTFSALSLINWAPMMKFRAFNPDLRYIESLALEVALTVTGNILLTREDGSNSLGVSYSEIANGSNRIILTAPGGGSNVQIRYRIQGGEYREYKGPFHLPLNVWGATGLTLIAEIKIPQLSEPIMVQEFHLLVKKEKLAAPEIISSCEGSCLSGVKVGIKADRNMATTVTTVEGQDGTFYVQIDDL